MLGLRASRLWVLGCLGLGLRAVFADAGVWFFCKSRQVGSTAEYSQKPYMHRHLKPPETVIPKPLTLNL